MKTINKTIPFKDTNIHVLPDNDGAIIKIALHDLCRILKRTDMLENEKAVRLCPSGERYPIYTNGKLFWFISISDTYVLLRHISSENNLIKKLCDELIEWIAKLPIGRDQELETKKILKHKNTANPKETRKILIKPDNEHKKYTQADDSTEKIERVPAGNPNEQITLKFERQTPYFEFNGKTYRNATQMGRDFGANPRDWLLKAETVKFRKALVEQGVCESLESQIITRRGHMGVTFLEHNLAVEFARWLDPSIAVRNNAIMEKLGKYGFVVADYQAPAPTPPTAQSRLNELVAVSEFKLPQTRSEALLLAAELARQIEEDRPKVEFYKTMIQDREHFTTYFIATELNITVINLYKFLVDQRIVKYEKKMYVVYSSHQALQCDVDYMWTNKNGKTYAYGKGKRWTKAGREYIIDLYKQLKPQNVILLN